jgi:hypothetical protein
VRWLVEHGLLARSIRERLPLALSAELAAAARRNLARNLHLTSAFERLIDALGDVPVCPLKGISLIGTVYAEEPEARLLTDLDVLVPEERMEEAVGRLGERLGLRETADSVAAGRLRHERTLEGDRLAVDVHGRLGVGDGRGTGWEALETVPAELHGRAVRRLADPDTLVLLLGHLVRHGPFARLAWAEDALRVGAVLEAAHGDAGSRLAVVEAATRLRARRELLAGVVVLRWLVGGGFYGGLESALGAADRRHVSWCVAALWRRQRRDPLGPAATGPVRRLLAALLLAGSWGAAAGVAAARLREVTARRRAPLRGGSA